MSEPKLGKSPSSSAIPIFLHSVDSRVAKTVKLSCWCQSEHICRCDCVSCSGRLVKGLGVRASSPEASTFVQKICCFTDISKHPAVTVAKKKLLAAVVLVSWWKKEEEINKKIKAMAVPLFSQWLLV